MGPSPVQTIVVAYIVASHAYVDRVLDNLSALLRALEDGI